MTRVDKSLALAFSATIAAGALFAIPHAVKAEAAIGGFLKNVCSSVKPCITAFNNGSGSAVTGRSASGSGLVGITTNAFTVTGHPKSGVIGYDRSTDNGGQNNGAAGFSSSGYGGLFVTKNPSNTTHYPEVGVAGVDASTDGGLYNVGVFGQSNAIGVLAVGLAPPQSPSQPQEPGLLALCAGGGPAMIANNGTASPGGDIMSLDCGGNMILTGTLTTNGTPQIATQTTTGTKVAAFSERDAQATIDDVGDADLRGGYAAVRLEPRFASAIDPHVSYRVFVTPEGDSRGLYVAQKTMNGFVVRENQGGRSSLAFSYRIVATPYGATLKRLPALASVEHPAVRVPSRIEALANVRRRFAVHALDATQL
ncbi:MAG: hypothetical protein ABI346_07005 [Candidatus Baltobacteraceae bacterium]